MNTTSTPPAQEYIWRSALKLLDKNRIPFLAQAFWFLLGLTAVNYLFTMAASGSTDGNTTQWLLIAMWTLTVLCIYVVANYIFTLFFLETAGAVGLPSAGINRNFARYVGTNVCTVIAATGPIALATTLGILGLNTGIAIIIGLIGIILSVWISFRLFVATTAAAYGETEVLAKSWKITESNVVRLFLNYLIVMLPIIVVTQSLMWFMHYTIAPIPSKELTFIIQLPIALLGVTFQLLMIGVITALQVTAFRILRREYNERNPNDSQ